MTNMKFTELTTDNAFDFCAVVDAVGISSITHSFSKEEVEAIKKNKADTRTVGIMIVLKLANIVLKNISSAREELYTFFAGCTTWDDGKPVTVEELRTMKISDFLKLLKDFFKKEDLVSFLEEAATLFNSDDYKSDADVTAPAVAQ